MYITLYIAWDYISIYRHDYPKHPLPSHSPSSTNITSNTLRQTHFNLGDHSPSYETASQDQSSQILSSNHVPTKLDQTIKNELRKSHFRLGNFDPHYNTTSSQAYIDRSSNSSYNTSDYHNIEQNLRSHHYILGTDKPDYTSETQAKYTKPQVDPALIAGQKVSTSELQQSHYKFGTYNAPWVTTHKVEYYPKQVEHKVYTKNLSKTNFILGDAEPTLKSVNQETFIRHPLLKNNINHELANDLRKHHFEFGKENYLNQLQTTNNTLLKDPKLYRSKSSLNIRRQDPQFLRESHWSLGMPGQAQPDHYKSTYVMDMTKKDIEIRSRQGNNTYKSSFSLHGTGPVSYMTESQAHYGPKSNNISENDIKQMKNTIKNIKGSHFQLGEMKNEYGTTAHLAYQFDKEKAKHARGMLDKALINDLRSTHYKLGYMDMKNQTTHRASFGVPKANGVRNAFEPKLQESHVTFNQTGNAVMDGKTIYMTDFVEKELPVETE